VSRGRHATGKHRWPIVVGVIILTLVLACAGSAVAAYRYDSANRDQVLPGITIAGVDVGGMTRDDAIRAVEGAATGWLTQPIQVTAGGKTWDTTPAKLGMTAGVAEAVDGAMSVSSEYSWLSRAYMRLAGSKVDRSFDVSYRMGKDGQTTDLVKQAAGSIVQDPVDAAIVLGSNGQPVFRRSQPGRKLDPVASVRKIREALKEHRSDVKLVIRKVQPGVSNDELGATVVVDISENRLYLYDGFKVDRTYRVATAAPGYETPLGDWTVIDKQENPTWINPAPNGWGAGEPAQIAPGPGNPLGTRAMYLDAPGIRIHGTYDSGSIGTYASHGCIRMNISDVEALYPHVPVGTPVLIVP
jgi:lipoprotein-anchoring transpeptidase ErfK/SrfK